MTTIVSDISTNMMITAGIFARGLSSVNMKLFAIANVRVAMGILMIGTIIVGMFAPIPALVKKLLGVVAFIN